MRLLKKALFGVSAITVAALADNPISSYHYLADPAAASDGEYFYIITDSDDPAPYDATGYSIKALYGFRSKDMQNWTDFGIIYDARQVDGINDIWASGIGVNPNDGKLYIVFPNGAKGVGLISADNIAGPWKNPVDGGKMLVGSNGIVDCDGIAACFDPAIFFDDDAAHTPYFTFGGQKSATRPHGDNFDLYQFNSDLTNIKTETKVQIKIKKQDGSLVANTFEASYLHKRNGIYYLSYSTDFDNRPGECSGCIDYAMSNNINGPYTYAGTLLENPHINGKNINAYNNNHHGVAEFKGKWYAVYHDRRIANGHDGLEIIPADDGKPNPAPAYHRSVSVDEVTYNSDGTMKKVTFTNPGPTQIENFDPYDWYPALTSSKQKGIRSRSNWAPGKVAESILLPLSTKESWIRVSGVDFGKAATGFTVEAASVDDGNKIEIHTKSATGDLAGICTIKNTGSKNTYAENSCEVTGLSGVVDYVFLVFKGSADSTMAIKAWGFEGSGKTPLTPQTPFGTDPIFVPGKIQAEDFDVPGTGSVNQSYYDTDEGNNACKDATSAECSRYREGTDVDIKKTAKGGHVIGWFAQDEWLEYTVNVTKAGKYTLYVAGASNEGGQVQFFLVDDGNEVKLSDEIEIKPASTAGVEGAEENYDEFAKTEGVTVVLEEGTHIIRMKCIKPWIDIDYFNFVYGENAEDDELIVDGSEDSESSSSAVADGSSASIAGSSASVAGSSASTVGSSTSVAGSSSSENPSAIAMRAQYSIANGSYKVFDVQGNLLGAIKLNGVSAHEAMVKAGYKAGLYILRGKNHSMVVNTIR